MSLMSKLLTTLLLSSVALVASQDADVKNFLKKGIGSNPNIISLEINIKHKIPVEQAKGWTAYIIELSGKAKMGKKTQDISQRQIYFAKGNVIAPQLFDMKTGKAINDSIRPPVPASAYTKHNLLYGNGKSKHKLMIFSDPLCPICTKYVPADLAYLKKNHKNLDVYYYHFPIVNLHPAAVTLSKASIAAELQGRKGMVEGVYKVKVDGREKDPMKILAAFNKEMNTNITLADISSTEVTKLYDADQKLVTELLINGTPTYFLDGKKDSSRKKFKDIK